MDLPPRPELSEHEATQREVIPPPVYFSGGVQETVISASNESALNAQPERTPSQGARVGGEAVRQAVELPPDEHPTHGQPQPVPPVLFLAPQEVPEQPQPVPPVLFLAPAEVPEQAQDSSAIDAEVVPQPAAEAANEIDEEGEAPALSDDQPESELHWVAGQAGGAIRAAARAGVDVYRLFPRMQNVEAAREIIANVIAGKTVPDVAAAADRSPTTVIRTTQRIASAIKEHLDATGYPDGLTQEMFTPHSEREEKRTGYAMETVTREMTARGITRRALAEQIDEEVSRIDRLLNGKTYPSPAVARTVLRKVFADDPVLAEGLYKQFLDERRVHYQEAQRKRVATERERHGGTPQELAHAHKKR